MSRVGSQADMKRNRIDAWIIPAILLFIAGVSDAQNSKGTVGMSLSFTATVDLGKDVGQNFGSLFEARDAEGRVVAGAGYLGAFNTDSRSDRRALQVFVRPPGAEIKDSIEALPLVTTDGGVYLYPQDGKLYARSRGGKDTGLRVWDETSGTWQPDNTTDPLGVYLGDGLLAVDAQHVTYGGETILSLEPEAGRIVDSYAANGVIIYRRVDTKADPVINELVAQPWDPEGAWGSTTMDV